MLFRTLFSAIFCLTAQSFLTAQNQSLVPWVNEGKLGFCDTSGRVVVPAIYNRYGIPETTFGRQYIPVYINDHVNWLDNRGQLMFPFDSINSINVRQLSQHRWAVHLGFSCSFKSLVVDEKFNPVFPVVEGIVYSNADAFSTAFVPDDNCNLYCSEVEDYCSKSTTKRLLDKNGQVLGDKDFKEVSFLYDGKFVGLPVGNKQYFIYNSKGKELKPFPYQPYSLENCGIVVVKIGEAFACADFEGKLITTTRYKRFGYFNRLCGAMQRDDNTWDVVHSKAGVLANIPQSDENYLVSTPLHFFVKNASGKWLGFDRNGRPVSKKVYDSAPSQVREKGQSSYRFKLESDSVYTDLNGKELYKISAFDRKFLAGKGKSLHFKNLWITQKDTLFGLMRIDEDGSQKELFTPQFDIYRGFTKEGFATVNKRGKWGVIDTAGNIIVPFEYERVVIHNSVEHPEKVYFDLYSDNKCGRIDQTGRVIVPFVFSEETFMQYYRWEPSPGPVRVWDKKVFTETAPGIFTECDSSWSVRYSIQLKNKDKYHLIWKGNQSGVMSNLGQWLIPFTTNKIEMTSDGKLALIKDQDHTAIVDLNTNDTLIMVGDSLIPVIKERYIVAFHKNANSRMSFSYWDAKRRAFLECNANFENYKRFDNPYCVGCVSDDFVIIRNDSTGKSGIRRYDGSWLLPCEYDYIGKINDAYYEVKKDNSPLVPHTNEEKFSFQGNLSRYSLRPEQDCRELSRPRPPFDLIDTSGNVVAKNFEALYHVAGQSIGYLSDGILQLLPGEKGMPPFPDIQQLQQEEINDSLLRVGILTGIDCTLHYGVTGIFKQDGTVIFPFSTFQKGFIPKIDKLYLKGPKGFAIYDLNGRRLTGDVFPSEPIPHPWFPEVFLVYTGPGIQSFMSWSGKILGPVK